MKLTWIEHFFIPVVGFSYTYNEKLRLALCDVMEHCDEKTKVVRILWCFCRQAASKDIIKIHVSFLQIYSVSGIKKNNLQ